MNSFKANPYSIYTPLVILFAGYVIIALYMSFVLKYDFLRSDVLWFWRDSLNWKTPFNNYHVPGYPLIIAFLRGISFGSIPPIILMMCINVISLLVCAGAIYQSVKINGISERLAVIGACMFGFWPFVGLVHTVNPRADVPAMAFLLTGLVALQNSRKWTGAILLGISLIIHKAMWPFVILIALAYICKSRSRSWSDLIALLLLALPLFILWLAGTFYHDTPLWMFTHNLNVGSETRTSIPLLQGVIATLQLGGLKGLVKGGLIVALIILSLLLMFLSYKTRSPNFLYGIAICVASLSLFIYLTHLEIWAAVRFSKLLVIPLIWYLGYLYHEKVPVWLSTPLVGLYFLIFFSTQFAFAWYTARVFFK